MLDPSTEISWEPTPEHLGLSPRIKSKWLEVGTGVSFFTQVHECIATLRHTLGSPLS